MYMEYLTREAPMGLCEKSPARPISENSPGEKLPPISDAAQLMDVVAKSKQFCLVDDGHSVFHMVCPSYEV